ncbi:hypothetical protein GCM10007161_03350 [Ignatzschineria indica]|nr:hypothetical protein GCM10007161_03350 [Ignatzschineria indica]
MSVALKRTKFPIRFIVAHFDFLYTEIDQNYRDKREKGVEYGSGNIEGCRNYRLR